MGRTVTVTLEGKATGLMGTYTSVTKGTQALGKEFKQLARDHKDSFDKITTATGAIGLGVVAAFGIAARSAMNFDKQMSEVGAVSNATVGDLGKLRTAAISAGQATVFSAGDAAQAEAELAKAGVSTADILGGALTGALSLASAGGLELADAATVAAQAMNIFNLKGAQVGHIADVLAAGANKSAADVSSLAAALKQGGGIAAMTGLSLEDTVGTLAAFADNALQGSDAGTSLKTMLQALQAPSGVTANLMKQLGINAYDTSGNFVGIVNLAGQLHAQLSGLTEAERAHAFAQIFGSDATRAANVLYKLSATGLSDYISKVNDTGAADDLARAKMNNLAGDVENLKGSFETLTIATGEGAQSGLRSITQAATRAVNSFGLMPATLTKYGMAVTGILGVTLLGGTALAKLRAKSDEVQESLTKMGPMGGKVATGLGHVTSAVSKLAAGLAVLQVTSAAFGTTIDPGVSKTAKDLEKLGQSGQATGVELKHLSYDIGTIGSGGWAKFGNGVAGTIESLTGLGSVFDESLAHAQQRIAAIDQGLAALVSQGKIGEAAAAFEELRKEADKQGISLSDLNNALPSYTAAMDNLGTANTDTADATQDNVTATDTLATSIEGAIGKANGLKDALDGLNGGNKTWVKAQSDLYAAFDAATASIKENGKTAIAHGAVLDVTTEKGRANMATLLGIADAAEAAGQASLDQTHDQRTANEVLELGRQKLYENARQMGLTKAAAWELVNQLLKIPAVNAPVVIPGITRAISQIGTLHQEIDKLHGKTINVLVHTGNINTSSTASAQRWGGAYEHAAAGLLREAGTYTAVSRGARYAFAEPQTGGEAFVPRRGNYGRSMSILGQAAGWYGASVVPGGAGGGRDINVYLTAAPGAAATLFEQLRYEVGHRGGVNKAFAPL